MKSYKEIIKGVVVIILAPIVYNIVASIGNIIGSLLHGDFTSNRTGLVVFISSGIVGFLSVNVVSFYISSNKIYYIIGHILNLILLILSMVYDNYNWLYYSVPLIGIGFLFEPKPLINKSSNTNK